MLQVDDLLPPATAALPSLRDLRMTDMSLRVFPSSVADRLVSLIDLNMRGNNFSRLPVAVTRISTLRALNLSDNDDLQLEESDSDTLAALPNLRLLSLKNTDRQKKSWSAASSAELICISKRFPTLRLFL